MLTSGNIKELDKLKINCIVLLHPLNKLRKKGMKRGKETSKIVPNIHFLNSIQNIQVNTQCLNHCSAVDSDMRIMTRCSPTATWTSPGHLPPWSFHLHTSVHPSIRLKFIRHLLYASHVSDSAYLG